MALNIKKPVKKRIRSIPKKEDTRIQNLEMMSSSKKVSIRADLPFNLLFAVKMYAISKETTIRNIVENAFLTYKKSKRKEVKNSAQKEEIIKIYTSKKATEIKKFNVFVSNDLRRSFKRTALEKGILMKDLMEEVLLYYLEYSAQQKKI